MKHDSKNSAIWFSSFCANHTQLAEAICALEQASIYLQALHHGDAARGPGILFFDQQTRLEEVLEHVQLYARQSEQQLIAVSLQVLPQATAWKLLQAGASDVIVWQTATKPIASIAARLQYWEAATKQLLYLQQHLIGKSKVWLSTMRQIVEMASANCPVILLGESGTGKELIRQEIHELHSRAEKKGVGRDGLHDHCTGTIGQRIVWA